ncbi:MAG: pyruvate formate lyase-activating protein, partial [Desulfurococcales archaeon ex4484_217_2]
RLSGVPKYFEVVTRNLKIAVKHGDMIIRHLVLPNHIECCTKPVLKWIAENLPKNKVLVNIMEQYRPEYKVLREPGKWPDIARRPKYDEISEAYSYAKKLGIVFEPVS